ncbi:MAG: ABC transporter substrate-binding protein [Candidatus Desulfacyla sp.]
MRSRMSFTVAVLLFGFLALSPVMSFSAEDPIVIGVPSSLKTLESSEALNAIIMAAEEINAKGGIKLEGAHRPLKIASIDTRGGEPGVPISDALLAIEKLFLEKKPDAVVLGPFRSEVLLAAMDLYANYKMVSINVAMTPKFIEKYNTDPEKYKYCFRMLNAKYVVGYLMKTMSKLNKDYGFNNVYIVVQDVLWASAIGKGMKGWFEKNGWQVAGMDAYPTGASDFSSSLLKAQKAGAQVIMPIFDMASSGTLALQWKDMRVPAIPVGFISPLMGSKAAETFGDDVVEGVVNIAFQAGNVPLAKYPPATNFFNAYKKRWGQELQAGHMPSEAYDSVFVMAGAIEKANSLDPDKLIKAIEEADYIGSIGRIRFKDHEIIFGENPDENAILVIYQWKNGKRVPVFPDSVAEGPIDKPKWMK